jgi:hypothetical protein
LILILNELQRIELLQLFAYPSRSVNGAPLEGSILLLLSSPDFKHLVLAGDITPSFLCTALSACPVLTLTSPFLVEDPDWDWDDPALQPTRSAGALRSLIIAFELTPPYCDVLLHARALPLLRHLTCLHIFETDPWDLCARILALVSPTLTTLVLICTPRGRPLFVLPALPALRSVVFEIPRAAVSRTDGAVWTLQRVSPHVEIVVTGLGFAPPQRLYT